MLENYSGRSFLRSKSIPTINGDMDEEFPD
jgi:hypothetical protein